MVDTMVRSRLAEIGAAAGVSHSRVGVEVLFKLPPALLLVYELLWDLNMYGENSPEVDGGRDTRGAEAEVGKVGDPKNRGGGGGGRTRDTDASRSRMAEVVVRSGGSARRAARGASRGSTARTAGVGNREAAEIKARADKRLRAVARDVAAELAALGLGLDLATGELMVQVGGVGNKGNGGNEGLVTGDAMRDAIDKRD
jgi:hypothetical protein